MLQVQERSRRWSFFLHRGFATPRWRIFAISLRDAADFAPDGVGPTSWRSLHFRRSLLVSDKIRLAPRPNHECRLVLGRGGPEHLVGKGFHFERALAARSRLKDGGAASHALGEGDAIADVS